VQNRNRGVMTTPPRPPPPSRVRDLPLQASPPDVVDTKARSVAWMKGVFWRCVAPAGMMRTVSRDAQRLRKSSWDAIIETAPIGTTAAVKVAALA